MEKDYSVKTLGTERMVKGGGKAQELVYCGIFTALIAVGAFLGAVSVGVYMFLGLAGLPIFTEGGGFWYLLKPSFGYIIGFCIGAYVTGKMVERARKLTIARYLLANFTGLAIVYGMGMVYYYVICNYVIDTPIGVWPLFLYCFLLAVPGDICLCILAAFLAKRLRPVLWRA